MKKLLIILLVSALIIPVTVSSAFTDNAQLLKYDGVSIQSLSNDDLLSLLDIYYDINDNGWVVWVKEVDSQPEIFLHNGIEATRITSTRKSDDFPQINNNGFVTWAQSKSPYGESDYEILLYNSATGTTTRLTDNDYNDSYPQINNNNQVVWQGCDDSTCEIFLYDGISTIQLTSGELDSRDPKINDLGYVTWNGCVGVGTECVSFPSRDWEVFLFDGVDTTRITTNEYADLYPQTNNIGQVVWMAEVDDADSEIMRYDYATHETLRITDNDYGDRLGDVNNNGDIVWYQYHYNDLGDWEIYMYDNDTQEIIRLTDNETNDHSPQINDNGVICWVNYIDPQNSKIYRYSGGVPIMIPGDYSVLLAPIMNEAGHILWSAIVPDPPAGWEAASTLGTDPDNTFERKVNLLILITPLGFALIWMGFRRRK